MGTRGLIGIRYKEKDKFTYNHFDSYPDCLGVDFLESIKKFSIEQMKKVFYKIKLIERDKNPSEDEIKKYGKLEVWKGFNQENSNNRYKWTDEEIQKEINWWKKERKINHKIEYFSCKLIKEYDLTNLPDNKQFLEDLNRTQKEIEKNEKIRH